MRLRHLVVGCALCALGVAPGAAQWINHPTPGIPRTTDGKPNLAAPTPRTADRKPDLSGVWVINGLAAAVNITDVEMLPSNCLPEGPTAGLAGLEPIRIVQTPHLIDDPKAYTKPFTVTLPVSYQADTDLIENVCLENEKDRPKLVGRITDEKSREAKVARSVLAGYVGRYGAGLPLMPQSDTQFVFHALGGSVRFVPDAKGIATQMILTIVEGDIPVMRKP